MWFPMRLSKVRLQALASLAVPAAAKEHSLTEKLNPYHVPWDVLGGKTDKIPNLQSSLLWSGEGIPFPNSANGKEPAC